MEQLCLSVCIVLSPSRPGEERMLATTRRALDERQVSPELEVVLDVVVEEGADRGAARTAALRRAKYPVVLALEPGETVDASSWPALATFARSGAALGMVSVLVPREDGTTRRERRVRLAVRDGARAEGASVDRFVCESGGAVSPTTVRLCAPARDAARDDALVEALRAEYGRKPADVWIAVRLAESLTTRDPVLAVGLASEALDALPLDSPDVQAVVLTLAEALHAGGGRGELLGLVAASGERFPRWPDLHLFEALTHGANGNDRKMVEALEVCLTLGEDETSPGTLGAGTSLPFFHLARFAERTGEPHTARIFYMRALPLPQARASLERLTSEAVTRARAFATPARLVDDGVVAMKACRHGMLAYPVNDAFVGRALDLYGEWCEAELDVLGPHLREGDVVLDIGANIGTHTVFFAKAVGESGKVIAFEPQRFAHGLLAANVATGGFLNVECRREAVGASPGAVAIPVLDPRAKTNFGAVSVRQTGEGEGVEGEEERVPLVTVDGLGLSRCDLLKIDVEGLEVAVLEGARETIARHRPTLFVENDTVARSAEVLRAVRALGYRAYWHIAPYFDANNHFGNPEDVFAVYQPQANLVCVPADRPLEGMLEVVGDDDDFMKALARAGSAQAGRAA